jgi:hypothetical protein
VKSVAWTGSKFAAVGGCRSTTYDDYSSAYTSADGLTWTEGTIPTMSFMSGIAWTGATYVAVGEGGMIYGSQDAVSWKKRESGVSDDLYGVAWTGTQLVAVGYGGLILTSP